jgi:hypothetical protein
MTNSGIGDLYKIIEKENRKKKNISKIMLLFLRNVNADICVNSMETPIGLFLE